MDDLIKKIEALPESKSVLLLLEPPIDHAIAAIVDFTTDDLKSLALKAQKMQAALEKIGSFGYQWHRNSVKGLVEVLDEVTDTARAAIQEEGNE